MQLDEFRMEETRLLPLKEILKGLLDDAVIRGICNDDVISRDLLDTRLMGALIPAPHEIRKNFSELYEKSPKESTDWLYKFSQDTNYIRRYRIQKDIRWMTMTDYGTLDLTINLSKPEKDPRAIAEAKAAPSSDYPKCQLCIENEGYAGRRNHPARQNHRIIPINIAGEEWFLQYSPYVYYNEHCILLNSNHVPMVIDRSVFCKLLDFIKQFNHYMIGSNADLPIVGGSILSHEHFQGGNHVFAMLKAESENFYKISGFENVEVSTLKWPMSVIRLKSKNVEDIVNLSDRILTNWRNYTDEDAFIYAETNGERHNTITPIANMVDGKYVIDLVLRNNITTNEHPLGVYHPHAELHHIKKENIGLIEVMGLAVLPSRLVEELDAVADAIINGTDMAQNEKTVAHKDWAEEVMKNHPGINKSNVDEILKEEVGKVFIKVLEHAGVYKRDENGRKAFDTFMSQL